jgi:hypothetical protein
MRRLVVLAVAALALAGAGCGTEENRTTAETEGIYLDINGLKYQLQLSRYLNGRDIEDREYLIGLPEGTAPPDGDETWFGVWVRVENDADDARPAATTWEIHDTQENIYRPIPIDTELNPFAFEPGTMIPGQTIWPISSSAAGQGPIQGSLLLFKVKADSLQNRPLELKFNNGGGSTTGTYDLDV